MSAINVKVNDWIDVDIDEVFSQIDTDDLKAELEERAECLMSDIETQDEKLAFIKELLGLKKWHDKERLLQEIESLY